MAPPLKQLPWELEEDILSRLSPRSLVRVRSVCQRWNALFNDKSFLNNHLSRSRPHFLYLTNSKNISIDIINPNSMNPTIELHELPSSAFPHRELDLHGTTIIEACDELLFCNDRYGNGLLWNPWLFFLGLGYDSSRPEKVYKILGYFNFVYTDGYTRVAIYECASQVFKIIDSPEKKWIMCEAASKGRNVSLNGNLYWLIRDVETEAIIIRGFDFSVDNFRHFCPLPCQQENPRDALVLAAFKGDGFSLLKQHYDSRKLEIWVTNKIDKEELEWRKLMTLPRSNFPMPLLRFPYHCISYFIYDKILFMCCRDNETREGPCIFIVREDLCKKIQIDSWVVRYSHCVYTPNLIPVPKFKGDIYTTWYLLTK